MLKNFKYSHCPFCDSGEYYDDKLAIHINNIHPDKLSAVSKLLATAKFHLQQNHFSQYRQAPQI